MQASDKPKRSPQASYEVVEDEAIIINLTTGSYYSLNDTGTMFWNLLDGERTIAECARLIAHNYDVEAGVVEPDLLELAGGFLEEGLIEL
jgi:hypothetical protein